MAIYCISAAEFDSIFLKNGKFQNACYCINNIWTICASKGSVDKA